MIKSESLGVLSVDCGDVVCFSMDSVINMACGTQGYSSDILSRFLKKHQGIECKFHSDGGYKVEQVTCVDDEGNTYKAVLVGAPNDRVVRLLQEDEQDYLDFYSNHPEQDKVGMGTNFNKEIHRKISDDHKEYIRGCKIEK